MDEDDFEGSLVLEKLAEVGVLDEFYEAIDSDNFNQAKELMKSAGLDVETISLVLKKMRESEGNH